MVLMLIIIIVLFNMVSCNELNQPARYYMSTSDFDTESLEQPIRCSFKWAGSRYKFFSECELRVNQTWAWCQNDTGNYDQCVYVVETEDENACGSSKCFHITFGDSFMESCAVSIDSNGTLVVDECELDNPKQRWIFKKIESDKDLEDVCFLRSIPCRNDDYMQYEDYDYNDQESVDPIESTVDATTTDLNSTVRANASLNLAHLFVTFETCANDRCLWQHDIQHPQDDCFTEYVLYSSKRIPCSPMSRSLQVVAKVLNTFGSAWVSGTTFTSAAVTFISKKKLLLHHIQCAQDILLGLSHVLIMFFVSRTDDEAICEATAISLTVFLVVHMAFIMLECICVYSLLTNTHNSWNATHFKLMSCLFVIGSTCALLPYLMWYRHLMASSFSCCINYENHIAKAVLILTSIFFSLSMIFVEAGISGMHKPLPSVAKAEWNLAQISATTLAFKILLSEASIILTSFSIFYQRFSLFPMAFGVNVALGWTFFLAHSAGNSTINTSFRKTWKFVTTCVN